MLNDFEGPVLGSVDFPAAGAIIESDLCDVIGWSLAASANVDRIEVRVDGVYQGLARMGIPRPDVALLTEMPAAPVCGFKSIVDLSFLDPDATEFSIEVRVVDTDGNVVDLPPRLVRLRQGFKDAVEPIPEYEAPLKRSPVEQAPKKRDLRIACFTHDLGYGGGQLYLTELLRRMLELRPLDITVIAPSSGPLIEDLSALGIDVQLLAMPIISNPTQHALAVNDIAHWLMAQDFDLVLGNTLGVYDGILAGHRAGLPTIWAIHESYSLGVWSSLNGAYTREAVSAMCDKIAAALRVVSFGVFEAEATRTLYLAYADPDRLVKVPYGIDIERIDEFLEDFDRDDARHQLGIKRTDRVITCIGTFEQRKQQSILGLAFSEVAKRHKDSRLFLIGDFPSAYADGVHAFIERAGLGGRLVAVPVDPEIFRWYAISDAFALVSDIESMPRSLLESMCFGVPSLATSVHGVPELIDDEVNGFLVDCNELGKLVERLDYILSLGEDRMRLIGERASETIRANHSSVNYARDYLKLVDKLVTTEPKVKSTPLRDSALLGL